MDSSITFFSQSLSLCNGYAVILSKLLIVLMGFPRLFVAFYTETSLSNGFGVEPETRPQTGLGSHMAAEPGD